MRCQVFKHTAKIPVGLMLAGLLLGADTPAKPTPPKPIAVGQAAPDFELATLTIEKEADGKAVGKVGDTKVQLSAFKGKKPVVLIFASYT